MRKLAVLLGAVRRVFAIDTVLVPPRIAGSSSSPSTEGPPAWRALRQLARVRRTTPSSTEIDVCELEESEGARERAWLEPARAPELVECRVSRIEGGEHRARRRIVRQVGCRPRCEAHGLQHVGGRRDRCGAESQERVRAVTQGGGDLPGNREYLPPVLEREIGGDQRARSLARLDDDRRLRRARR